MIDGGVVESVARRKLPAGEVDAVGRRKGEEVFRLAVEGADLSSFELRDVEVVLHGFLDEVHFGEFRALVKTARDAEIQDDVRAEVDGGASSCGGVYFAYAAYDEKALLPERLAEVHGLAVNGADIFDLHL